MTRAQAVVAYLVAEQQEQEQQVPAEQGVEITPETVSPLDAQWTPQEPVEYGHPETAETPVPDVFEVLPQEPVADDTVTETITQDDAWLDQWDTPSQDAPTETEQVADEWAADTWGQPVTEVAQEQTPQALTALTEIPQKGYPSWCQCAGQRAEGWGALA